MLSNGDINSVPSQGSEGTAVSHSKGDACKSYDCGFLVGGVSGTSGMLFSTQHQRDNKFL